MATFADCIVKESEVPFYLKSRGYTHTVEDSAFRGGCALYTKHLFKRDIHCCEKHLRLGACIAGYIATFPLTICCLFAEKQKPGCFTNLCIKNYMNPCNGFAAELSYVLDEEATKKAVQDEFKALGFDPNDAEARKNFMESQQILSGAGNHEYCLVKGPVSQSYFYIFAPYRNRDTTKLSYCYNSLTGEMLDLNSSKNLLNRICRQYTNMDFSFAPNIHTKGGILDNETTPLLVQEQPTQFE